MSALSYTFLKKYLLRLRSLMVRHKLAVSVMAMVLVVSPFALVVASYATMQPYRQYVYSADDMQELEDERLSVGLVLGSGITKDGKPFRELQSRLDVAAEALESGVVDKLLLSGDNRFPHYNEPAAMKRYLVEKKGVSKDKLQEDFAGRSTYESCERAAKVFGLEQTVLISARSHLPRAIYLCRQFGVDSYGIASPAEANNQLRREAMARVKAVLNVHVKGENTILGAPISL